MSIFPFLIAIDTGGTFTDCIATDNLGNIYTCKVLSNSTLRGSIEKWIDSKTIKVKNNWRIQKDIFKNYEFRFINLPFDINTSLSIQHNNNGHRIFVEKYDPITKIVTLNHSMHQNR